MSKFLIRRSDEPHEPLQDTEEKAVKRISDLTERFPMHQYEVLEIASSACYAREIGPVRKLTDGTK